MHKFYEDTILNYINYMSKQFRDYTFYGFMKTEETIGCVINGNPVVAVHISSYEKSELESDDDVVTEQKMIDEGFLFVAVIYGIDNCSYMKRFKSKQLAVDWMYNTEFYETTDDCLFYNS
jgi:hypothetical protein